MTLKFIQIEERADCTTRYNVEFDEPCTLKEFIDAVLTDAKESGNRGAIFIRTSVNQSIMDMRGIYYTADQFAWKAVRQELLEERIKCPVIADSRDPYIDYSIDIEVSK